MQSTSNGIREYTLTNGQRVLVEVGEIVDQEQFTFTSIGGNLIIGIISGKAWVYVFSQRGAGEIYRYLGNISLVQEANGILVMDVYVDGLRVDTYGSEFEENPPVNHARLVSRRRLPGE